MYKSIFFSAFAILLVSILQIPLPLQAEEASLTERELILLEKVECLEKRIENLEKVLAAQQTMQTVAVEQNQTALEERVAQIEEKVEAKTESDPGKLRVFYKSGLRLESEDGQFKLRIGGRIQTDFAWIRQGGSLEGLFGDEEDGAEFRRARIYLQGDIYKDFFYKAQFDFAGDDAAEFKDVYLGMKNIPVVGKLTIGHRQEPFGLEQLTSSKYITFMERALPDAFTPGRNLGVMVSNNGFNGRLAWAAGLWKTVDDWPDRGDSDEDQGWAFTGRISGLPWYAEGGRKLLHLGVAYSHRNPDGASYRIRQRPESHLAFSYIDTGAFDGLRIDDAVADDVDLYGFEMALVLGPFSVQGEYMMSDVDTEYSDDARFDGYYVQASYFLTGENRVYKLGDAIFDRVSPHENFSISGENRGWGAWELGLRYSFMDLDDGFFRGGEENNITAGINWYLNPNMRMMLNYVYADIQHYFYDGELNIIQTRFQVEF